MSLLKSYKKLKKILLSRILLRNSLGTAYTLLEACLIGVFSAFAALFLKEGIGWLGSYRIANVTTSEAILILPLTGLVSGLIGGWLIENVAPEAAGGGIPQVKAALSGFPIPLSLKTALVKSISTIVVLGSSFVLGRRAPTVHIGASLAAQLSDWLPTTPERRRQMIAAGAASGLAAGFNTPIAGVLFVAEELMRDASNLTLETAILASFVGSVVSRHIQGPVEMGSSLWVLEPQFTALEITFYILLGLLAGLFGGLFNRFLYLAISVHKNLNLSRVWSMAWVGLISGIVMALLPDSFLDKTALRDFIFISQGDLGFASLAFVSYFFLTILAASSGAPGGLFAPALILGASLGDMVGILKIGIFNSGLEQIYTLAGMGAFFTAVVRVPVTATVIVFEMTEEFDAVLPLMIACGIAYFVAEAVSKGSVYEHLLLNMGMPVEESDDSPYFLKGLTAASIMQKDVEVLTSNLTLDEAVAIMSVSQHKGFPVLEKDQLVGIFTKGDWQRLGSPRGDALIRDVMTPRPISVSPETSLSNVLYLLNEYHLSRLPVVDQNKLLGIITRTDILEAETQWISGKAPILKKHRHTYTIYQTRSYQGGKGRILLPLVNPETAPSLFKIAAAIASYYDYEIECLQVIQIPKHSNIEVVRVNQKKSRILMQRAEKWGNKWNISTHTRVCLAQDVGEAILEIIAESNIDLLLMGWKGISNNPTSIFGNLTDNLMHQAPCDLMLVKMAPFAYPDQLIATHNWLIPVSGGPNIKKGIEFLPGLLSLYPDSQLPLLVLAQVLLDPDTNMGLLDKTKDSIKEHIDTRVVTVRLLSESIASTIINLATKRESQVVMLGASRAGLLQQAIQGNIAKDIARKVDGTVILFRSSEDF